MKDFLFSPVGREYLQEAYVENERSTYDIAQERGVYANLVNRALKHHGFELRTKAVAQKAALAAGRHEHPTKGRKRTPEEKERISESMADAWAEMDDTERERRVNLSRQQWAEMDEADKERMRRAAGDAMREAAKLGSKLEQHLLLSLRVLGYSVQFHSEFVTPAFGTMHVDLLLTDPRVAIEVDGPGHHLPIFGEEQLAKTMMTDNRKTGALIQAGYVVLRVKHISKGLSDKRKRVALENTVKILESVKAEFPPVGKRLVELEI